MTTISLAEKLIDNLKARYDIEIGPSHRDSWITAELTKLSEKTAIQPVPVQVKQPKIKTRRIKGSRTSPEEMKQIKQKLSGLVDGAIIFRRLTRDQVGVYTRAAYRMYGPGRFTQRTKGKRLFTLTLAYIPKSDQPSDFEKQFSTPFVS